MNQNPYSETYGSFDRDYWHYKTLRDFESATYQQGVLALTLIYLNNFTGNIFHRNKKILRLIKAGIGHWREIQNNDGSFNEWFLNEHSHVATAFTAYAVTESILLLKDDLEVDENILKSVRMAGDWLCSNSDYLVTNHIAGALMALYNIFLISNEEKYLINAGRHLEIIQNNQNKEGWFLEYDGCDPGYLSVSVDFLAKYYEKSRDESLIPILDKAINFMSRFIHPDGTYGGEYGSRNTKYLFTHGLSVLSDILPRAAAVLRSYSANIDSAINFSADDRYTIFFFLPNYLQAFSRLRDGLPERRDVLPIADFEIDYPEAGIFCKRNQHYHLILNYKKGGIIKLFSVSDKKLVYADTGYMAAADDGSILHSQSLRGLVDYKIKKNENIDIVLIQRFAVYRDFYPLKKYFIPFKLFNYVCGKSRKIMAFFNKVLKNRTILYDKLTDVKLERNIIIAENQIKIIDKIVDGSSLKILSKKKINNWSPRHVPSSNFTVPGDLLYEPENKEEVRVNF